jgi:hypothetical protein
MKFRNILLALKDQGPFSRFWRNLKKGHLIGLFSKRSHFRDNGNPKVCYNTKETATRSAAAMQRKNGTYYSNYKCVYCDGYHIGRNSENKV